MVWHLSKTSPTYHPILGMLLAACFVGRAAVAQPYRDFTHHSQVFNGLRNYRAFLPPGYEQSPERYPVIYYFHGHSDRYTLEHYDAGLDTVPKIAAFVATHGVIVVAADGYVARDYTGFYGGAPYGVMRTGGDFDYGEYFLELVRHIDGKFRTLSGRRFRATAGLSMGGFMSLYLSARYPDVVGSASAFNPGPEFFTGERGRRSLWRPKDHVLSHKNTMVRLVRASGDYISQYHEETRAAYASAPEVDFEYRQDEYHRHWATSIAETFDFHMRAFGNALLDKAPGEWSYASAQRKFDVHGYQITAAIEQPALVQLDHVGSGRLRISTRQWAPDGPPAACIALTLTTAPLYRPSTGYRVLDYAARNQTTTIQERRSDAAGRLTLQVDCSGHELGIAGPGASPPSAILTTLAANDLPRPLPGRSIHLPVRVLAFAAVGHLRAEITSHYPNVEIVRGTAEKNALEPGKAVDLDDAFVFKFVAAAGDFSRVRLELKLNCDGAETKENMDVMVAPDPLPPPAEVAVLDGRTRTFSVFRQKGNQGGGASIERTVMEGFGNANAILEPGEVATIWLRLPQGIDPFDKNNWCRTKVYSDSVWIRVVADIQEDKQREWTGAQNRTSRIRLSQDVPAGVEIPLILDCESWSFRFTPDVRYGKEPLYQAFQVHQHHLFGWNWTANPPQPDHSKE